MNSLSALLIVSISWLVDDGWIADGNNCWDLDAPNAGEYSIVGELDSLLVEGGLSFRYRQKLNGSNSNNSTLELSFSDSLSLQFSTGMNGSDDPLQITSSDGSVSLEVFSDLINFAEPLDMELKVNFTSDSVFVFVSPEEENLHIQLCSFAFLNTGLSRFSFTANCTSSQPTAFSFGLNSISEEQINPSFKLNYHNCENPWFIDLGFNIPMQNISLYCSR